MSQSLRVPAGPVDLSSYDPRATPGFDGTKKVGRKELEEIGAELAALQEQLFAAGRSGDERRVLLVLQGMDTAGKGGTVRHVVGKVDPQGVQITSFKAPTAEELEHDFLWRVRKALPDAGMIGVFDRSHYEDVLIGRVRELAPAEEIERRYGAINDFEAELVGGGVTVVKCMLHISSERQKQRLARRLQRPDKHWKFEPGDIDERSRWPAYQRAYEIALERTNTEQAPWHVVPADRRWFRNLAVGRLLLDALRGLELSWPEADFDVAHQQRRLRDEDPLG
jgi:PPK2 family polyphosphate:nucleotide phosphotransferase